MKLNTKLFITAGVVITTAMMNAQSTATKLPGDATLPSSKANLEQLVSYDKGNFKYKVEDYFARPKASQFKISPDGQFLSYKEKDNNKKNHVYVKDLKSGKITKAIEEKEDLIKGYGWLSKNRLYFTQDKGGNENLHLYAVDTDGKNLKDLTPFDGVKIGFAMPVKDTDFVVVTMNKNNKQILNLLN